jgi:hypothetical protein
VLSPFEFIFARIANTGVGNAAARFVGSQQLWWTSLWTSRHDRRQPLRPLAFCPDWLFIGQAPAPCDDYSQITVVAVNEY